MARGGSPAWPLRPARRDGAGRAVQRRLAQLARMRVAGLLAEHGAQAEAERRIRARCSDATFLEGDSLALPVFQEELAVIATLQRAPDEALRVLAVEVGAGTIKE